MSKLHLLFKTDDNKKEIAAAHESSEIIMQYLNYNHELAEPEKLGQGWEVDLLIYDETGKTNLIPIKKYTKELSNCNPDEIQEGGYYNIAYWVTQGFNRLITSGRTTRIKCIEASPPEFVFDKQGAEDLYLHYNDIIVIAKCRENEDCDDGDRFIYYSHQYEWRLENGDGAD